MMKTKIAAVLLAGLLMAGVRVALRSDVMAQAPSTDAKAAPEVKTDIHGDPLPAGAAMRLGTLRWRHGTPVVHVAYVADEKSVLSVTFDGLIRVWEQSSGKELRRFGRGVAEPEPAPGAPNREREAPAGKPGEFAGPNFGIAPPNTISTVAHSADGKVLATGFYTGEIQLWDVAAGKALRTIPAEAIAMPRPRRRPINLAPTMLTFSPDGKSLLVRSAATSTKRSPSPTCGRMTRYLPSGVNAITDG